MYKNIFFSVFILSLFFALSFQVNGQKPGDKLNVKPRITSPNAAAIEKFIEFPAAGYTGVPNISIPFYSLLIKNVEIPIGISYHASGVKVDEVAGDVGLGWSLNFGGAISILNNGMLDEISGYPFIYSNYFEKIKTLSFQNSYPGGVLNCNTALLYRDPVYGSDPYYLYSGGDAGFLTEVVKDLSDSEPDVYTFSFGARSGKFFQDQNGIFRTIPHSDLRINRITQMGVVKGYTITDENGVIYEYQVKEESNSNSINNCSPTSGSQNSSPFKGISRTYFLSAVKNTKNERIDFFYTQKPFQLQLQQSFTRAKFINPQSACSELNSFGDYYYQCPISNSQNVGGMRIDSIKSTTGDVIVFRYGLAERYDLPGTNALTAVEVWSTAQGRKKVKNFQLSHGYYANSTMTNTSDRLKLLSVTEDGKPPYEFEYNNTPLPPRLSFSQDHYGYYNGANNTTLLPKDEFNGFMDGANREPNNDYTQAGILNIIKYPTGGSTEFIYEPNSYYVNENTIEYYKRFSPTLASLPNEIVTANFTITGDSRKVRIYYSNQYDGTVYHNDNCEIKIVKDNYSQTFFGTRGENGIDLLLSPGTYSLEIKTIGNTYSGWAYVTWFEKTVVLPHAKVGGGLRIKEIKKLSELSRILLHKKYEYVNQSKGVASGVQLFQPIYSEYKSENISRLNTFENGCNTMTCELIVQNGNSIAPLTFTNGNYVSYLEVLEYDYSKEGNGYTQNKYLVSTNGENNGLPVFPYAPRVMFDWINGVLSESNVFAYSDNEYKQVSGVKNYYNYTDFNPLHHSVVNSTYGAKIAVGNAPFVCWQVCTSETNLGTTYSGLSFGIQRYQLYSSWHRLEYSEKVKYDCVGNIPLKERTYYFYDNPSYAEANRIETIDSKGDTIKTLLKFPHDISGNNVSETLLLQNRINTLLEKRAYVNSTLLEVDQYEYKIFNSSLVELHKLQTAKPFESFITKFNIHEYDLRGNILHMTIQNGHESSYMWGYQFNYLTAEIIKSNYSSVSYSSFESNDKGNWEYNNIGLISQYGGITGNVAYNLLHGSIQRMGLQSTATYVLTYWQKDSPAGSVNIGGVPLVNKNGWTLYQTNISGTDHLTISGNAIIDELRLYPKDAQMTTYTYEPLVGMTSQCDPNNRITYYEYDPLGRMKLIRDQDRNIIKTFEYNYKQ
jgi:YD repeat-containing protein